MVQEERAWLFHRRRRWRGFDPMDLPPKVLRRPARCRPGGARLSFRLVRLRGAPAVEREPQDLLAQRLPLGPILPPLHHLRASVLRSAVPRHWGGPARQPGSPLERQIAAHHRIPAPRPVRCRRGRPPSTVVAGGAARRRSQRTDRRPRRHIPGLPGQYVLQRATSGHLRSQPVLQRRLEGGTRR